VLVKGPFGGSAAAWSPDGRFLYVAGKTGLSSFRNELTPEEIAASSAWKEELAKRKARGTAKPGRGKAAEPLAELAAFSPSIQKAEVVKAIQKAEKEARGMRPPSWQEHPAYVKEPDAGPFYQEMLAKVQRKEWGPLVYQVRERKAKAPEAAPLDYLLALGQYNTNQADKVQGSLQAALKVDRGQTDLSIHCLRGLAAARGRANDAMGSAHCYAMLLLLDPADATLLEEASTVFKKAGLEAESRKLLAKGRASAEAVSGSAPAVKLPPLAAPKSGSVLKGPDLYRQVAPGVVRLQAGDRSGTGVCVADKGWILTNAHVAGETGGTVEVHTFAYQGGKLQPLKALPGTVVYSSAKTDVAVVKLEAPPSTLVAVPVADKDPQPGEKVFAIGSPGLGATTLAQSLSEGIVSAAPRQLPEGVFIQHTAAVNPGNSGGPLVDERGRMVGLVTLKAKLENVGFAIPSVAVRAIFEQASK
jgi:S1-C subfamily serine protease